MPASIIRDFIKNLVSPNNNTSRDANSLVSPIQSQPNVKIEIEDYMETQL